MWKLYLQSLTIVIDNTIYRLIWSQNHNCKHTLRKKYIWVKIECNTTMNILTQIYNCVCPKNINSPLMTVDSHYKR